MASKNKADYAYTPDDIPSHWKLDISDPQHIAAAKAALGKGFRGKKVQIPRKARKVVIAKLNRACKRFGLEPYKEETFISHSAMDVSDVGRYFVDQVRSMKWPM